MHRGFQVFPLKKKQTSIHELPIFEAICERHMLREDSVRLTSRRQEDVPWPDPGNFRHPNGSQWIPMDPVLRC